MPEGKTITYMNIPFAPVMRYTANGAFSGFSPGFSDAGRVSPTRYKLRMSKGFTLLELIVVTCIAAILMAFWVPRAARLIDWLATERAVRDVTTALAVGRHGAVMRAIRARVAFDSDTIRIDRLEPQGWVPWWRTPSPASHGVQMEVSNPVVFFGPNGMAWGVSNTKIVLRRGSQAETITMSRVGRVKHW